MKIRLLVGTLLAAAGALVGSAPAHAVQTDTWGLAAAPAGHAQRATLTHPANGSTVHDGVVVYNRTAKPISVHLYVLGTTYANGVYQFGKPDTGLAADTSLGTNLVELGPHQVVEVPVTVRMPRGTKSTMLAGIGGEAAPINHGVLSIEEQLVVLIKATPTSHLAPIHLSAPDVAGWGAAAAAMLAGVIGLTVRQRRHYPRLA
jgi:hypothetical protein